MIPLIGFAPDADTTTPGVITDCTQLIPYDGGMQAAPSAVPAAGATALAEACAGAAILSDMADARRTLAGTATSLYEFNGTAWVDVSRGAAYALGVDSRWQFEQYGNTALAVNGADYIQRSIGSAFADIAGSPKAEIILSAAGFAIVLNFNDGTVTPDGWYCSALYDETNWTPDVSTQATKGRLVSAEGPITAGKRLGNYIVAYKAKAIYLGQYVGAPVVWQWDQMIGGDAGCIGKEAIADIGGAHVFVNDDGFWIFDGSHPVQIGNNQVRKWWLDKSDPAFRYRTIVSYDKQTNLVWFYYCSKASNGQRDSALVYHLLTKQWGRADRAIEAAVEYVSHGVTIDGLDAYTPDGTMDSLPLVPLDSPFWAAGGRALGIFNLAHQVCQMNGAAEASSLTTGDFGDDQMVSMLKQVRPRFAQTPDSGVANFQRRMVVGGDILQGAQSGLVDGRFPTTQRARWHRARMDFTGEMSITGYQPELVANGKR